MAATRAWWQLAPGAFHPARLREREVSTWDFSNGECTRRRINPDPVSFPLLYMFLHMFLTRVTRVCYSTVFAQSVRITE